MVAALACMDCLRARFVHLNGGQRTCLSSATSLRTRCGLRLCRGRGFPVQMWRAHDLEDQKKLFLGG